MKVQDEEVFITLSWQKDGDDWSATAVTATPSGFRHHDLAEGDQFEMEVTSQRRCIGYVDENGRHTCPNWETVPSGSRCEKCRRKDIHVDYIEGRSGGERDGSHSVYFAQSGEVVKVGVTRSERLMERWVEQGAAFAVEVESGLTADEALSMEADYSESGMRERIQKSEKTPIPQRPRHLLSQMDEYGIDGEIVDCFERTAYSRPSCTTMMKTGRVVGKLDGVAGGIISVGGQCIALASGRCLQPPQQKGLEEFL